MSAAAEFQCAHHRYRAAEIDRWLDEVGAHVIRVEDSLLASRVAEDGELLVEAMTAAARRIDYTEATESAIAHHVTGLASNARRALGVSS